MHCWLIRPSEILSDCRNPLVTSAILTTRPGLARCRMVGLRRMPSNDSAVLRAPSSYGAWAFSLPASPLARPASRRTPWPSRPSCRASTVIERQGFTQAVYRPNCHCASARSEPTFLAGHSCHLAGNQLVGSAQLPLATDGSFLRIGGDRRDGAVIRKVVPLRPKSGRAPSLSLSLSAYH